MSIQQRIETIKQIGYEIDFTRTFNKSLENYKKIALQSGIVLILFSVLIVSLGLGIVAIFVAIGVFNWNMSHFNIDNYSTIAVLMYVLGASLLSGLLSPMSAGFLKMAHHAANKRAFNVSTAFFYYKSAYFKELFIAALLLSFLTIGVNALFESLHLAFWGLAFTYVISFFTLLTIPFIYAMIYSIYSEILRTEQENEPEQFDVMTEK